MITPNQLITSITFFLLVIIFLLEIVRFLKVSKRSRSYYIDALFLVGISGAAIDILGSEVYHASLPVVLILVFILIKVLHRKGNIIKLEEKHDITSRN